MNTRHLLFMILLILSALSFGCSDSNSSASRVNAPHPAGWVADSLHGPVASDEVDFASCQLCHGVDLQGAGSGPSCFSASIGTQSCHAGGPAPHPVDGSFLDPENHGPQAKADLVSCQGCHGEAGGAGSNPRFNVGIESAGGTGCEACHGVNFAHPADWAGPNDTFHYSAGNVQNACTLCHGVDFAGGADGGSCLGCHASVSNFSLECTFCHGRAPDDPSSLAHGEVSRISSHDVCVVCHGVKESATGGTFSTVANYARFDAGTDTNGDHWNGRINMNSDTSYNEDNFGCDTAACHDPGSAYALFDSKLTVQYGAYGYGSDSVPHPLDDSFLLPANHGPAAEARTASFPNGMLDCQSCHATAGTDNPLFNIGISNAGDEGCESCHSPETAHPLLWYDVAPTHSDITVTNLTAMCVLCHDTSAGGPVGGGNGPACSSCHPADPLVNSTDCDSCHNSPPNSGGPVGDTRPNRAGSHTDGEHSDYHCDACHEGSGYGTAWHFDDATPADVNINNAYDWAGGSATYNSSTRRCSNISCHNGEDEGPW